MSKSPEIVYVDTNVYLDWILWRRGRGFMGHQGEEAKILFDDIKAGKYILLTSDHLEYQIKNNVPDMTQYTEYIHELDSRRLHMHIMKDRNDEDKARMESQTNRTEFEDALHFVLAIKGNATLLVTQNEPDFRPFMKRIRVRCPKYTYIQ
ncbi:MAG: PIN domain-containing protein [Nanoarchaeota archaeon]